jgi:prefoldin subunit 5
MEQMLKQFMEQMNQQMAQMNQRFDSVEKRLENIEETQDAHRKETAFQYNQLQMSIENTRSEMRSSFKHLEDTINQHRDAFGVLQNLAEIRSKEV